MASRAGREPELNTPRRPRRESGDNRPGGNADMFRAKDNASRTGSLLRAVMPHTYPSKPPPPPSFSLLKTTGGPA